MPLSLYLLAVAVFAMGTSEFMLAGLLPDLAADLGVPPGTAGLLTSAFAIGLVIGAPLMAALARRWPRRASLCGFLVVFLAAHVAGAVTGSFALLFATRVLAALANAGFLAVALTTAADVGRKGRAVAVLLAGTTLATVAGVPGGALLGAASGWRATFWAVALLCLPALAAVLLVPAGEAARGDLRRELAQLRRPRLLVVLLLGALVNAATFGSFTFLALLADGAAVPVVLVLFGLGSFAGVTVAGRLSDDRPGVVLGAGGLLLLGGWLALAAFPGAVFALAFTQGALSFGVGGTLIALALHEAAGAPTMAGSYATAALNVGAAAGPALAAAALGVDERGPAWVSAALVAVFLVITRGRAPRGSASRASGDRPARE
ncbi:Cmx/CmrA family chloramphenicol efflux MFS transporter [Amycolatopsis sacchari]|uniref:MFS transporter, DHA1 family, chloramphenicol resistance protein n=1 Tax=Amycolatopsis sacchari TaxID=115433 RepID=A0A1I3M547_9PSEU|nr:Cmx/CmrA family chloramphenicol efflux MFS transporter [Amycolatopsis sacchari]SFI91940.1 MFS transporter, DHA1 family, chloramphenicol resistance protein [Amycolatopsis sacchari]